MAKRAQKRIKKEKAGRRWTFSLSVSILAHALAAFAVPGFTAIHEKINIPVLEHFLYVDISQREAAPEAAGPDPSEERDEAAGESAGEGPPRPEGPGELMEPSGPAEPEAAGASLAAAAEVSLNSVEKTGPPAPVAEAWQVEGVLAASAGPEGIAGKRAGRVSAGDVFAPPASDGEFAGFEGEIAASPGEPSSNVQAGRKAFVSYTGSERAGEMFATGAVNIPGAGGSRQDGAPGDGPGPFASVEREGAAPQGKAGIEDGTGAGAPSGPPAVSATSGKGRYASLKGMGGRGASGAEQGRSGGGEKALSIGKIFAARPAGSPVMRAAGMKAPEEARAEITIFTPANNSTFDALSCGEINISGSVKGGGETVSVCLNGKTYEAGVKKGIFNIKLPPEAEENLLFAEKADGNRVLCRSEVIYFKILNIDPGELAVFMDRKREEGGLKFRCSWKPHPLAGMGGGGQGPGYEMKVTQQGEAVSVKKVTPGIYTIGVDYDSPGACEAALRVYLYSREPVRRKSKLIPVSVSGKGYIPAVRVLLPEGVFWEDESWFSGTFENSRETTKFRQPEGIVWKEEN